MSGRHWLNLPGGFEVGLPPPALVRPAPGERTISNAEVPLPRSPLSLAAGTANRKAVLSVLWRVGDSEGTPPPGAWFAPSSSAAQVQPRGCKGRSPLHKITFSPPPSPWGKGVGGMGAGRQAKGRGGRRPKRQAPLGHHSGRDNKCRRGQAHLRARGSPPSPSAARVQPRGCKGRSPSPCQQLGPFRNHSPFWRTK